MFKNIIGQKKIIGKDGIFNKMILNEDYYSVILYGTPGSGKTTLAQEFVKNIKLDSYLLNAVNISKMELTNFLQLAQGNPIILVIDEIHRLDRTKQDLLLPYLEKKEFYIIGTTTQNPYYSLSQALCSRFFIFEMEKLNNEEIYKYLKELDEENSFSEEQLNELMNLSKGDIRKLKMYFQFIIKNFNPSEIKKMKIDLYFSSNNFNMKSNHNKYDLLSALQKSIRASDVNAAIFYLSAPF